MNDSQILSYIFYSLDHCGPISEARANALAAWIKRCRAEEVELQESMSACTKTAEERAWNATCSKVFAFSNIPIIMPNSSFTKATIKC